MASSTGENIEGVGILEHGKQEMLPRELQHNTLYHGTISGNEAEKILCSFSPNICHLLRFSIPHCTHVLSVKDNSGNVLHFKLIIGWDSQKSKVTWSLDGAEKIFDTLQKMLHYYSTNPLSVNIRTIGSPCKHPKKQPKPDIVSDLAMAINNKKCLKRKVANIILQGLPESGKTSLLDRILGKPLKESYSSTGISESLVTVEITPTSTLSAASIQDKSSWKIMDLKQSFISQLNKDMWHNEKSKNDKTRDIQHQVKVQTMYTPYKTIANTKKNAGTLATTGRNTGDTSDKQIRTPDNPVYSEVGLFLMKHSITKFSDLENTTSIYIRDVGGQIEFQECLSLLLYGPSIFLFVMKTNVDLHTKVTIQYRTPSGEITNKYKSSISNADALLQLLGSISALQTTEDEAFRSYKPMVFIVGTHIDLLGSEAPFIIDNINEELDKIIRASNFLDFVQYANWGMGEVMYLVDNTAKKNYQFEDLKIIISKHISERQEFTMEYPISYLLFSLELNSIDKNVLSMDTVRNLAAKFKITGNEVSTLLHFLHFRVGAIQHYDVDGLRDLVIKEPQVLFNSVTNLIVKTFLTSGSLTTSEQENFCKKGIMEASAFDNLLGSEDEMTSEQFLHFLLHLRMAVPFMDKFGDKKYFLPSVLNHVKKSLSAERTTDIATLAVTFQRGHSPKGLFGMLISHLMKPKHKQPLSFSLMEDSIYKDQVSFLVHSAEDVDEICLKMNISHFEVQMFLQNSNLPHDSNSPPCVPRLTPPSIVCRTVCSVLEHSLQQSLKSLHYNSQKVGPMFCLKCSHDDCDQFHQVKKGLTSYYLYCNSHNIKEYLQPSGQYWFNDDSSVVHVEASSSQDAPKTMTESVFPLPINNKETHETSAPTAIATATTAVVETNSSICTNEEVTYKISPSKAISIETIKVTGTVFPTTTNNEEADGTSTSIAAATANTAAIDPVTCTNEAVTSNTSPSMTTHTGTTTVPAFNIQTLTLLKWKVGTSGSYNSLRLRNKMSSKWEEIGDLLGLDINILENINKKRQGDMHMCCRDVLHEWIGMETGSYPANWDGLVCLLKDVQLSKIAEELQQALTYF